MGELVQVPASRLVSFEITPLVVAPLLPGVFSEGRVASRQRGSSLFPGSSCLWGTPGPT